MGRVAIDPSNPDIWIDQVVGIQRKRIYALYLACQGLTHKQIALAFNRSVRTINQWMETTKRELGARTKNESLYLAGKMGLFDGFNPVDKDVMLNVGVGIYREKPKTGRPRLYRSKQG